MLFIRGMLSSFCFAVSAIVRFSMFYRAAVEIQVLSHGYQRRYVPEGCRNISLDPVLVLGRQRGVRNSSRPPFSGAGAGVSVVLPGEERRRDPGTSTHHCIRAPRHHRIEAL